MEAKESQFCVNCKVRVDQQKRYVLTYVDNRVISLISSQITPLIITDEDRICEHCYKTALDTVKKVAVPPRQTIKKSCLLCESHLQSHQSFVILKKDPSAVEEAIVDIVHRETPHEITPSDCLCFTCFQKIKNKAVAVMKKSNPIDEVVVEVKIEPGNEMDPLEIGLDAVKTEQEEEMSVETQKETDEGQEIYKEQEKDEQKSDDDDTQENDKEQENDDDIEVNVIEQDSDDDIQESDNELEYNRLEKRIKQAEKRMERYKRRQQILNANTSSRSDEIPTKRPKTQPIDDDVEIVEDRTVVSPNEDDELNIFGTQNPTTSIRLPNYKRSANTSTKCFFHGCSSKSRHRLGDEVRMVMLTKYKFYIPKHARVCLEHLSGDGWDTLYQKESLNDFSAQQIEHILSLVE